MLSLIKKLLPDEVTLGAILTEVKRMPSTHTLALPSSREFLLLALTHSELKALRSSGGM